MDVEVKTLVECTDCMAVSDTVFHLMSGKCVKVNIIRSMLSPKMFGSIFLRKS